VRSNRGTANSGASWGASLKRQRSTTRPTRSSSRPST
jgi:hypothetical protein